MSKDREQVQSALTRANQAVKQALNEKMQTEDNLRQAQEEFKKKQVKDPVTAVMSSRVKELEKQLASKDKLLNDVKQ